MERLKKHLCFYNDSMIWGGHEMMSVEMVNILVNNYKITFLYANEKYRILLDERVNKIKIDVISKTPLPFIRNLNIFDILKIKNILKKIKPNIVIAVQGTIELSSKVLIASKILKYHTVSYIPIAYSFTYMKKNKIHLIRDVINLVYYHLIDSFITPSTIQQKQIEKRISRNKNIMVIENPINPEIKSLKRDFSIPNNSILSIVYIGRLIKNHKNIFFLFKIAIMLKSYNIDFLFHIIGGGEDEQEFKQEISAKGLNKYFKLYGWINQNEILNIIKDKSLVIIPSNFETDLSLVVLELLYHEMPIVASDIEAFHEIPKKFKFSLKKEDEIFNILQNIIKEKFSFHELHLLKHEQIKKHSEISFKDKVLDSFSRL